MSNHKLLRYASSFIILSMFILTALLPAEESVFDSQYAIKITGSYGFVDPPSIYSDYWLASNLIDFDNGLYGFKSSYWKHESQAKQVSEFTYSGNVNLVFHNNSFSIVYEGKKYSSTIDLWVDWDELKINSRIKSVTEQVETIAQGWSSDVYKYRYLIELEDGTIFLTKDYWSSPWTSWKIGTQIIKIGNSRQPCLINVDDVKDFSIIEVKDCLNVELLN